MTRLGVLLSLVLLWWLLGPWVAVVAVASLLVPRMRWALLDARPATSWSLRRVVGAWTIGLLVLVALAILVPDGWVGIPQGPGRWASPAYVGRPALVRPIPLSPPGHPHLAPAGAATRDGDSWASGSVPWAGPVGDRPEVDTAWFGLERCGTVLVDAHERLVAHCAGPQGRRLRVIDPAQSLRPAATLELPDSAAGCLEHAFFLDDRDRAVLATGDRRVVAVTTADGDGEPALQVEESWDLARVVPEGDCVVGLLPGWDGRLWWTTAGGLVGTLAPLSKDTRVLDLGSPVSTGLAVDSEATYVVTDEALVRLEADADGRPQVGWRLVYDRGLERKSGQPSRGSGTTPTLLLGGLVAIADNAEPRMHVVVVDRGSGTERCRTPVFASGASATASSLASVDGGVLVTNEAGHDGPTSTLLGFTSEGGVARVSTDCRLDWSQDDLHVPSSGASVAAQSGLAYVVEKRPSIWGVSAWYLAALDVRTGRRAFAVRIGTDVGFDPDGSSLRLTPDGSVFVSTLAGLVRVRDRP